jgi:phage tail-like protein
MVQANSGYLLLDAVAGWRAVSVSGLVESGPDRSWTLQPLPGAAAPLLAQARPPDGEEPCAGTASAESLVCPAAIVSEGCGRLLIADAAAHRIKRLDVNRSSVTPLGEIGGLGSQPRRFREPRGLALLPHGGLVVADTGNHRVQVFSPAPYALRYVWGATDERGRPIPGAGPGEFHWPWAVAADACGTVYVVDRWNRRIQVFGSDGTWRGAFGSDVLMDPTKLALGPGGVLAVIDGVVGSAERTSQLCLFLEAGAAPPICLLTVTNPRSAVFTPDGHLYVGDAIGLIHTFVPDADVPGGYRKVGEGATGLAGAIVELAFEATLGLIAVARTDDETGVHVSLWRIDPAAGCILEGTLATGPIDSGLDQCHWHRVACRANLPAGTVLVVRSLISNDDSVDLSSAPLDTWNSWSLSGANTDLLLPSGDAGTGRYLWLRLTLQSDGAHAPSLSWVKIYFPRESYLQYLPAVYQEDDESRLFLERFLSIFQTEFDRLDDLLDTLGVRLLDPASADSRFLPWLAAWFALATDPSWSDAQLRSMIKGVIASYRVRGTVAGLEQAVRAYAGVGWGKVLEHYRLRRWPTLSVAAPLDGSAPLWSPDFYRRLRVSVYAQLGEFRLTNTPEPAVEALHFGANQFSVFFPADPARVEETRKRVAAVVEREKPAHTQATFCPVFPRFRVGVQATVGVDSVVGGLSPLLLNRLATLGYDTVLAGSAVERQVQKLGTSPRPRVGVSLKLT